MGKVLRSVVSFSVNEVSHRRRPRGECVLPNYTVVVVFVLERLVIHELVVSGLPECDGFVVTVTEEVCFGGK